MEPPANSATPAPPINPQRKKRPSGFVWILLAIAAVFLAGGLISTFRTQRAANSRTTVRRSNEIYFGVQEFINAEGGGVTFNDVYPPDSPADKAGLVGGDVIKSFDGHPVALRNDIVDLLQKTPPGKTVEVTYVRDGELKTTRVTTISSEQFDALVDSFEGRPAGQGQLGYEDLAAKIVPVSGSNISGVQINRLSSSGPAALAGIHEGDVIIEFDGVPIRKRGELIMRVRRAIPYSTVNVVIVRGGTRMQIPVKVGKR